MDTSFDLEVREMLESELRKQWAKESLERSTNMDFDTWKICRNLMLTLPEYCFNKIK